MPAIVLKSDAAGAKAKVARVAIYHYRGRETVLGDKHLRVGMFSLTASCKDDRDAIQLASQIERANIVSEHGRDSTNQEVWSVSAQWSERHKLTIVRRENDRQTLSRRVLGSEAGSEIALPLPVQMQSPLLLNGRSIAPAR